MRDPNGAAPLCGSKVPSNLGPEAEVEHSLHRRGFTGPRYLDQVGSVTLPRPLTTGVDFPVGTSSREMVLPVL